MSWVGMLIWCSALKPTTCGRWNLAKLEGDGKWGADRPSSLAMVLEADSEEERDLFWLRLRGPRPFILQLQLTIFTSPCRVLVLQPVSTMISVQLFRRVQLFVTPWTATHQASLAITNSWSLLKLMSIELVMPSNHLILCCPPLPPPSILPSIRVLISTMIWGLAKSSGFGVTIKFCDSGSPTFCITLKLYLNQFSYHSKNIYLLNVLHGQWRCSRDREWPCLWGWPDSAIHSDWN